MICRVLVLQVDVVFYFDCYFWVGLCLGLLWYLDGCCVVVVVVI